MKTECLLKSQSSVKKIKHSKKNFVSLFTNRADILDIEFTGDTETGYGKPDITIKFANNFYYYIEVKTRFSVKEKRIVFLELAVTVLADGVYTNSEKKLIQKLSQLLDIKEFDVNEALDIAERLKTEYDRCALFVTKNQLKYYCT